MSWLPSFFLWGGIAASIPVIVHLFFRSRYRVVHWAAMDFLLKAIQETSRRLKFQELLLLLLRIAVFTLLALVLALTLWRVAASWGGGGAVDAVLLLDVSGSMNAKEGTRTRFDLARDAAREVIDSLPASSTVRIVLATDRAKLVGPRQPANLDQARELLDKLDVTNRATDFLAALQEATSALQLGTNPNKEVYLISDMQKQGLLQSAALKPVVEGLERDGARLFAVHCGTQTPKNATIEGILPQSGILHTGTRASFAVLVRNTTGEPIRDLKVSLRLAGQEKGEDARTLPILGPGELKPVPLSVELKQGGYQILTAAIEPDDLAIDNRYDQVIRIHEQVRVLIVDGAPNPRQPDKAGSYFLTAALTPVAEGTRDKYFVKTRTVPPRSATPLLLSESDVVVLADVPLRPRLANEGGHLSAEFLDELDRFVRAGKGVLIFAGPNTEAAEYNEELVTQRQLLPLRLGDVVPPKPDEKVRFSADPTSIDKHGLLASFGENPQARILSGIDVRQYRDTADPSADEKEQGVVRVVMKYSSSRPALALRHVERGKVLLCTTTADTRWNDWPIYGHVYLPLVHESLAHLLQSDVQGFNRRVGQPLTWSPPAAAAGQRHVLAPPVGDEVRLGVGEPNYRIDETDRAGVYRVRAEVEDDPDRVTAPDREATRQRGAVFAVTPDPDEGQTLEPGTDNEVNEGLGGSVTHVRAGQGGLAGSLTERRSQEWSALLWAVLALLLCESALAWHCGRAG